jgi:hypothetical protein
VTISFSTTILQIHSVASNDARVSTFMTANWRRSESNKTRGPGSDSNHARSSEREPVAATRVK